MVTEDITRSTSTPRWAFAPPRLLRALDHVTETQDGYIADCPICTNPARGTKELLAITPGPDGHWRLHCDGDCTHRELAAWLQCDTLIDPYLARKAWVALMLSPTPETWAALTAGTPVPDQALDPLWVNRLRKAGAWNS